MDKETDQRVNEPSTRNRSYKKIIKSACEILNTWHFCLLMTRIYGEGWTCWGNSIEPTQCLLYCNWHWIGRQRRPVSGVGQYGSKWLDVYTGWISVKMGRWCIWELLRKLNWEFGDWLGYKVLWRFIFEKFREFGHYGLSGYWYNFLFNMLRTPNRKIWIVLLPGI